jgi:hypothetical protein
MRRSLLIVLALLAGLVWASTAFADATPVELMLTYLPNVSNTETPEASGIAELVLLEGEVRITATGLPHLEESSHYVAWLVNSQTNQYLQIGAFNTNDKDAVHYENVLEDAIPDKHWNLLLVTVESGAHADAPSDKHSLAALFPSSERETPPQVLPNTGGEPVATADLTVLTRSDWLRLSGLAALAVALSGAAGYALGKR